MFVMRLFDKEIFACGKTQAPKGVVKPVAKPVAKTTPARVNTSKVVRVKKTRKLLGLSKSQWRKEKRKPGFDPWMPTATAKGLF